MGAITVSLGSAVGGWSRSVGSIGVSGVSASVASSIGYRAIIILSGS